MRKIGATSARPERAPGEGCGSGDACGASGDKNGGDRSQLFFGGVTLSLAAKALELLMQDDGPGMANLSNVFVPFFTTKPQGSGIGLVLSWQIA